MEKINTSLGCPNCHSADIQDSMEFLNEKTSFIKEDNVKIITRQKIYNCKCNSCGHNYVVDHGNEKYILFEQPYPIHCSEDVCLLAVFETESGFERGYKLCSTTYSPYEKNTDSKEEVYLMLIEGEEFPVVISKETVQEMIYNRNKARDMIVNTFHSRHR